VALGALLIPINSLWIFECEIIRYQGHPTTVSLFFSSIFTLVLLLLMNLVIRRVSPRRVFSQAELITIYVMLNIGAALVGHDSIQILVSLMPYAAYFATPANKWQALFEGGLPDWLVVKDKLAVKHFYLGGSLYDPQTLSFWIVPVLWWSLFIVVLLMMFLCMNVLLRRQWTEREKLSYPLVQLPLEMTAEGGPLFREKLLWVGFVLVAILDIWNGLATLYPSIPIIPIKLGDQAPNFTTRPWNNIGWFPVMFYPFGVGLGMLLPVDLLFSCWFFFWTWKAQNILTAQFGLDTVRGMPFVFEQSFGAYIGICAFAVIVSRKHFIDLIKHFFGSKPEMDDSGEAISYRAAMWLLVFGGVFLYWFSHRAGLSGQMIIVFFAIYFALCIAITRMRAELGPPAHDLHAAGPDVIITNAVGPAHISTQELSVLSLYFWFNRAYRCHPMPIQLEGFKMAEPTRSSHRGLFVAMIVAAVVGTITAFWVILHLLYSRGAASSTIGPPNVPMIFGMEPWNRMEGWVKNPRPGDVNRVIGTCVGFAVTMILNSLRMRLGWFPFHPVGYAVSSSWAMSNLWMCMFIAWGIKLAMLRYGGLKLYRSAVPFFLGVILGECVVGSLWTIIGIVFGVPSTYAFWP